MSKQNPFTDLGKIIAKSLVSSFAVYANKFANFGLPRSQRSGEPCAPPMPATMVADNADLGNAKVFLAGDQDSVIISASPTVENTEQAVPMMPNVEPVVRPRKAARKSRKIVLGDTASRVTCPAPIADPELDAIRTRVASLEAQVVDLETRKAEMEQLIEEFTFCQYRALGELVGEQLRLQHELLRQRAERSSTQEDQQAAAAAAKEYQDYQKARDEPESPLADLADGEREELKALYRVAVMRCHPDRVSEAAKPLAHEMFLRTQDAYKRRDLESMRLIHRQLAVGDTALQTNEGSTPRELLEGWRESLLDKGAELLLVIQSIKMQAKYRQARNRQQWDEYFTAAREQLEEECGAMRRQLAGC